jgi:hypothetical protein
MIKVKPMQKLTASVFLSQMRHYANRQIPFQDMINILSYDYDLSFLTGKVKNKYQWDYSIMLEYNNARRNRYANY